MFITDLIRTIRTKDEAQPSVLEVILAYPGFHILVLFYPLSRILWSLELRALARLWAHIGRMLTGIEIHPGAKIGRNLFIDHGFGVVIGQTAVIGDECRLYHNVTLGSKGDTIDGRRHPVLGDHVIVGAGAQVLGPITIGNNAKIGASAVVTSDIPADVTAIGNPARLVGKLVSAHAAYGLPDGTVPDPIAATLDELKAQINHVAEHASETH